MIIKICRHCGMEELEGCEVCRSCKICGCICKKCKDCGKIHPRTPKEICPNCRRCKGVCKGEDSCRKMPSFLRLSGPSNIKEYWEGKGVVNTLQRMLGLELELNPVGNLGPVEGVRFELVRDGSLQNGGQEMVVWPLGGDRFLKGIVSLVREMTLKGSGVDQYCGYHVHVGARDYGPFELRRMMNLYSKVEGEVFRYLVSKERAGSRFCKPFELPQAWYEMLNSLKTGKEIRKYLLQWLYGERVQWASQRHHKARIEINQREEFVEGVGRVKIPGTGQVIPNPKFHDEMIGLPNLRAHKYEQCRYFGLNYHSWFQRGTLEWRHHQGTVDLEEIIMWALFCGWMVELGSSLQDSEVNVLTDLRSVMNGEWKRPFMIVRVPEMVREWVLGKVSS